ncbi:MAG TPA: ABC transporter ATP-binding protein [Candidatus Nanopelagicales bacterium]|nr:ABC transporter ATP-binding protein [Candidatus Nanopelagicales bacterium]
MPDTAAVEIDDLVVRYGAVTAVDRLSLRLPAGAVSAVLGPNGAGKTTTVETCEGYRAPSAGRVRVLGRDPVRDGRELRPRVGVMLQEGGVAPAASATTALAQAAAFYREPLPVDALLGLLGLVGLGRTPYRRLSGGEKQRVKLAVALIGRPELVFLDEPTAGLDPQARLAVWELVRALRRDGVTVVLTTHLMDEAEQLADHVVIVDRGRVVADGSPVELTGATASLLTFHAVPGLDTAGLARALPGQVQVSAGPNGRYQVSGPVGPQLVADLTAWCATQQVLTTELSTGRRTLEDVFLELTGRELRT